MYEMKFWIFFLEFIQDEEHSILFSTHITSDIQKVADYVILIHNGKIIFEEKKDDLIYNYGIIRCKKIQNLILFRQMTMYVVEKQILAWNA